MANSLLSVCKQFLTAATTEEQIDDFFISNKLKLQQMVNTPLSLDYTDVLQPIELADALKYTQSILDKEAVAYKVFVSLLRVLIAASNPNSVDHFKFVQSHVQVIIDDKLLHKSGNTYLQNMQQFAREYSDFCIAAGKTTHAVCVLLKLIEQLSDGITLTTFHCQYAKLSLKSLCYQQALPIIEQSYIDV